MTEKMTPISQQLWSLKGLIKKLEKKSQDPNLPQPFRKPSCPSCGGSTWLAVYKKGKRYAMRCPGFWFQDAKDPDERKWGCTGNPHHEEFLALNKKDLAGEIWHTLIKLETDEDKFLSWFEKEYGVTRPEHLNIEQLEALLQKIKHRLIAKQNKPVRETVTV